MGCLFATATQAQDIGTGSISVRLTEFSAGLGDITGLFNGTQGDGDGQFTATDFSPLSDGSGRVLVSTLGGKLRLLDSNGSHLDTLNAPYANVGSLVPENDGGFGTTGLAVHPNFSNTGLPGFGKIYAIRTEASGSGFDVPSASDNNHVDVLVELMVDDPTSDSPTITSRDVARFGQPGRDHNVFDLAFDANEWLYLSSGDGGGGNSQTLTEHHGTIMRIDPVRTSGTGLFDPGHGRYGIPDANLGVTDGDANTIPEAYALGLRSPYRMNFHPETGRLYLGDVGGGGNESINLIEAGLNYGWPTAGDGGCDADGCNGETNSGLTEPIFAYGRDDGETVVGGFIYEGVDIPALAGKYVFADFGRQVTGGQAPTPARLFYGDVDGSGDLIEATVFEFIVDATGELLADFVGGNLTSRQFIFSIGEDVNRELYLVVGDDPQFPRAINPDGRILRIVSTSIGNGVPGDVNQDGFVTGDGTGLPTEDDVAAFVLGWKTTGHATLIDQIMAGDLDLNGITNFTDWYILRTHHPNGPNLNLGELLAVPEPASLTLWAVGLAGLAGVKARRVGTGFS
ncbi:MAG: PQQ-dependent sugar dehydrogenase [Aeoliella sp.]